MPSESPIFKNLPETHGCVKARKEVVGNAYRSLIVPECEELSRITFEAPFVTDCNFGSIITPRKSFIKTLHGILVPSQVICLESETIHRFDHGLAMLAKSCASSFISSLNGCLE